MNMSIGNVISLIGLVVAGVVGFFTLQGQTDSKITKLQNKIDSLEAQIEQAENTASSNKTALAEIDGRIAAKVAEDIADLQPIPTNIVVAFDGSNGCPSGWASFGDAAGRVIIGAGDGARGGSVPAAPTTRKYREHGGEERVALSIEETPAHFHSPTTSGGRFFVESARGDDGRAFNMRDGTSFFATPERTHVSGGDAPHNNMPPYIALYFCKKGAG